MLEALGQRFPMAVVSTRSQPTTLDFLESSHLLQFFSVVVSGQTCARQAASDAGVVGGGSDGNSTRGLPDGGRYYSGYAGWAGGRCLSFPDEQLWLSPALSKQDVWVPLQTRRGCPINCSYCSSPLIEGSARRVHSPEGVVGMLGRYVKAGFSRFYFTDNTLNIPSSYAAELCSRMLSAGLKISWMCILYPWEVKESLIKIMALAGCHEVSLGFESGNEGMLSRMNKKFGTREVRSTSLLLQRHGIRQMGFLLLGGPGETRTTVAESLEFADSLPLDAVRVTAGVRIYPHTTLARQAVEEGVVSSDDDLLHPRFYLAQGLEGWLDQTLAPPDPVCSYSTHRQPVDPATLFSDLR